MSSKKFMATNEHVKRITNSVCKFFLNKIQCASHNQEVKFPQGIASHWKRRTQRLKQRILPYAECLSFMVNFWGLVEPLAKYQDQKPNLELCSFSVNQLPRFLNSYMQSNGGAEGRNKERMFIL